MDNENRVLNSINLVEPDDVGKYERKDLLYVFNEILVVTGLIDENFNKQVSKYKEIENTQKEAQNIRDMRSSWCLIVIIASTVIGFIIGFMGNFLANIVFAVIGFFMSRWIAYGIDNMIHSKEREKEAVSYLETHLPPLQEQLKTIMQDSEDIKKSKQAVWAQDIVGKDLFNTQDVTQLKSIVENRRADNLKEALNKYDSTVHTQKMEDMQKSIQEASEITAAESVKQTAHLQEVEKNSRETATAAKISAAANVGTYKNTRRN